MLKLGLSVKHFKVCIRVFSGQDCRFVICLHFFLVFLHELYLFAFVSRAALPSTSKQWSKVKVTVKNYLMDLLQVCQIAVSFFFNSLEII